jgi:uncharacterized Tic20 family protein
VDASYHINRDGQSFGPYALHDLQEFYKGGRLLDADLVWAEHLTEWTSLGLLPERVVASAANETLAEPAAMTPPPPPRPSAPAPVIVSAPPRHYAEPRGNTESTSATASASPDRTLAVVVHVLSIFFSWLGPLVIYLIKKGDADTFTADNAREALNFQITICLLYLVCAILTFVVIGIFLFWIVMLSNLICSIIAAVKASNGISYKYPMTLRLIR